MMNWANVAGDRGRDCRIAVVPRSGSWVLSWFAIMLPLNDHVERKVCAAPDAE